MLFLIILAINSTKFITKTIVSQYNRNKTYIEYCQPYHIIEKTMNVIHPIIQVYIPYLIMVVLNIIVILRLRDSKKRSLPGQADEKSKVKKFAVSTILIDLIFLIFKSPEAILQIYVYTQADRELNRINQMLIVTLVLQGFALLAFSYSIVLIFIFLIFNRLFRQELIRFFRLDKLSMIFSTRLNYFSSNT